MANKKIVLFTTEPESFVQERFAASAEKAGFDLTIINPDECYAFLSTEAYFANNGTKFDKADACIPRLSEEHLDYKVAIMKHMEKIGVKVLNTGASMRTASNKIETQIILNDAGIKTPKSALFINEEQLEKALDSIGGKFPVIVKTIFGTHGVGVIRADSLASLRSIAQQLIKSNVEFMLQEYIEHKESARILVLGKDAIAAVLRTIPDGDFRSNAHQGAELKKYDPSQEEVDLCVKAAELIGAQFGAVDYITVEEDGKKEIYLLEINGSPGFEAMQKVIDFDIADKVIEFVGTMIGETAQGDTNKQEDTPTEQTVTDQTKGEVAPEEEEEVESESDADGHETEEDEEPKHTNNHDDKKDNKEPEELIEPEKVKIDNDDFSLVGSVDKIIIKYFNDEKEVDVRIDTGAEYSSINGSDIDLNDDTISFTFGDYRYRFSLIKSVKIIAANGKEKRPIIRLDIVIDGKVLHNVEFTVNDRGGLNYDVLLGRRALAQANVLVNPAFVHLSNQDENEDAKDENKNSKEEE